MTAAAIMLLTQEGRLGLDDPVSKYVPGVPNGDNITIAELLRMRSGLYNYTNAPELAASLDHDPAKAWTPAEVLAIAFNHPPLFPPGQAYDYCNTNYALLGLIAERIEAQAPGQYFSGSFVWTAWHEGDIAPGEYLQHTPQTLRAWLPLWQFLVCFGGYALPRRYSGRGEGGNIEAQ